MRVKVFQNSELKELNDDINRFLDLEECSAQVSITASCWRDHQDELNFSYVAIVTYYESDEEDDL